MALSNTATPKYYGRFRETVMRGEIPVCKEISMEMNRIDDLIRNPGIYYDNKAMDGFVQFCEKELTLTDGSDLKLLETVHAQNDKLHQLGSVGCEEALEDIELTCAAVGLCAHDGQEDNNGN